MPPRMGTMRFTELTFFAVLENRFCVRLLALLRFTWLMPPLVSSVRNWTRGITHPLEDNNLRLSCQIHNCDFGAVQVLTGLA